MTKEVIIIGLIILVIYLYYQQNQSNTKLKTLESREIITKKNFSELISSIEETQRLKLEHENKEKKFLQRKTSFLEKNFEKTIEVQKQLIEQNKTLKNTIVEKHQEYNKKIKSANEVIDKLQKSNLKLQDGMKVYEELFSKYRAALKKLLLYSKVSTEDEKVKKLLDSLSEEEAANATAISKEDESEEE